MNNPLIHDIRTRPTAFIAMVLLVVLGVQLGMWQIRRADYKKSVALERPRKADTGWDGLGWSR